MMQHSNNFHQPGHVSMIQFVEIDHDSNVNGIFHVNQPETALGSLPSSGGAPYQHESVEMLKWEKNDPGDPENWSTSRKLFVTLVSVMLVLNSTMNSSLPSMAIPAIAEDFEMPENKQSVLPISIFLVGFIFGPLLWGPLSEQYGRYRPSLFAFCGYSLAVMACGLSPNWGALLIFRFFCGVFGSAPVAIAPGIVADIHRDPGKRGKAIALYMVATVFGPLFAPIISGFSSSTIGWRWSFWIALILATVTLLTLIFLPETYSPVLLSRRGQGLRKKGLENFAPRETEATRLSTLFTIVLTRPIRMVVTEPLVTATCAYLSLVYAILYMSFQVFPIVFQDLYHLSPGVTGLCYLPIGGGASLSLPLSWYWSSVITRATSDSAAWAKREEMRRLPLAIVGGPVFASSLFWLGFTAREDLPFFLPMLAGIPFGFGFMLIFMALLNYLTDAYDTFSASANAAASCCRSIVAVALPFATSKMFSSLGIAGACSVLGGLSAGMCIIPWVFLWKGSTLRARSKFCLALQARKAEQIDSTQAVRSC